MKTSKGWMRVGFICLTLTSSLLAQDSTEEESGQAKKADRLPAGVEAKIDIEYVPGGGKLQMLDLYLPANTGKPLPLVVFIHPGGFHTGEKNIAHAAYLLPKGYAVASINYRLVSTAHFPDQIEDCRSAIRFLRANAATYRINPDRIGVWGTSAGGHLASMLGTAAAADFSKVPAILTPLGVVDESIRVQCVVDWYGPVDLGHKFLNKPRNDPTAGPGLLGPVKDEEDLMAKLKWASPITYVRADNPPFLIQHGDADPTVSVDRSREFSKALKEAGVEVTYIEFPGGGHGSGGFNSTENKKIVSDFFDKHLKK